MKEVTKGRWKKFGYFCLSWVPLLMYAAISFGVSMVGAIFIGVVSALVNAGDGDMYTNMMKGITESAMVLGMIYAIIGIIAAGLWYYFGCKRKKLKAPKGILSPKNLVLLAVFAFCMQYVTNYLMNIMGWMLPNAMESYVEMMEMAGLDKITAAAVLYGVILGPIAEELTFRGLTLYFAEKFTKRFWLANTLQALAFGIIHMNLIQGTYAFLLGLIIGWMYKKYHSLYAAIVFHIFFNFMGFTIGYIDALLPQHMVFQVLWGIFMCAAAVALIVYMSRNVGSITIRSNSEVQERNAEEK